MAMNGDACCMPFLGKHVLAFFVHSPSALKRALATNTNTSNSSQSSSTSMVSSTTNTTATAAIASSSSSSVEFASSSAYSFTSAAGNVTAAIEAPLPPPTLLIDGAYAYHCYSRLATYTLHVVHETTMTMMTTMSTDAHANGDDDDGLSSLVGEELLAFVEKSLDTAVVVEAFFSYFGATSSNNEKGSRHHQHHHAKRTQPVSSDNKIQPPALATQQQQQQQQSFVVGQVEALKSAKCKCAYLCTMLNLVSKFKLKIKHQLATDPAASSKSLPLSARVSHTHDKLAGGLAQLNRLGSGDVADSQLLQHWFAKLLASSTSSSSPPDAFSKI